MEEIKQRRYYEQRIEFVARQYLCGKINYEDIAKNRLKLIRLLNGAVRSSKNIENKLGFQVLKNILDKTNQVK